MAPPRAGALRTGGKRMEIATKEQHEDERDWIDVVFSFLSGALMIAITAILLYCVLMRYWFNKPPIWSEDVPRVLFVWMTYLAAVVATRRDTNIKVTFIVDKFPRPVQLAIDIVMTAIVVVMMLVLAWYSWPVIELNLAGTMLSTGWNESVFYLPLPASCLLMAMYQAKRLARLLQSLKAGA
jgi:TRAP-type C4-dicarboxylate transport system permease small subunit